MILKFIKLFLAGVGWLSLALAFLFFLGCLMESADGDLKALVILFAVIGALFLLASKKIGNDSNSDKDVILNKSEELELLEGLIEADQAGEFSETKKNNAEKRQVICGNCGANIHVNTGSEGECEYCGSHVIAG